MKKTIRTLLALIDREKEQALRASPTFLELIGADFDEEKISMLLEYVLYNDAALFSKLVRLFSPDAVRYSVTSVTREKALGSGRADLFVLGKGEDGSLVSMTIENKINSSEHGDQTETYFKFVNSQNSFAAHKNLFLYLKPAFNPSEPTCKAFLVLTYGQLSEMIEDDGNPHIADFKRHIAKFLGEREMDFTETDRLILQNRKELKEGIKAAEDKFKAFKARLAAEIFVSGEIAGLRFDPRGRKNGRDMDAFPRGALVIDTEDNATFRIFRKDVWQSNAGKLSERFYFYVELKFCDNASNEIYVQEVAKRCGKNCSENVVVRFVNDVIAPDYRRRGHWETLYYVMRQQRFVSANSPLSPAWTEELKRFAVEMLTEELKEMDLLFSDFSDFRTALRSE